LGGVLAENFSKKHLLSLEKKSFFTGIKNIKNILSKLWEYFVQIFPKNFQFWISLARCKEEAFVKF